MSNRYSEHHHPLCGDPMGCHPDCTHAWASAEGRAWLAAQRAKPEPAEHRDVWLIWETNPGTRLNHIRAIDEDEETVRKHMLALASEARLTREGAKFYTEKVQTDHLYGHGALTALSAAMQRRGYE